MKLLNAFPLNMLFAFPADIHVGEISLEEAKAELVGGVDSAVGHTDTAAVFSTVLGIEVSTNRVTVTLNKGETVLIGQYIGPRLPEGATNLPEGATIKWLLVEVR